MLWMHAEAAQNEADDIGDNQSMLNANSAASAADDALENWLNAIHSKIGKEPEGEEGNEEYIADEGARNQRYQRTR